MRSLAVHDLVTAIIRGRVPGAAQRRRAFAVPVATWRRVLGFEGCAVQFHRALLDSGVADEAPTALRLYLREETSRALRNAVLVHRQLPAIAALAAAHGIQIVALKGAARLLAGEAAGARSIADIDLLVTSGEAERLHELLQSKLGYVRGDAGAPHHLPGLTRPGHLGIEVHHRLSPDATPLDTAIREGARRVQLDSQTIDIPSPTALLLHTLEHAVSVNWTARYRLRDISDVAALCSADVSFAQLREYVRSSPARAAFETLLSAAHDMAPDAPVLRRRAWSTVRRVSRTRMALAVLPQSGRVAERCFRYAGVLAEGSPRVIWRAGIELFVRGHTAIRTQS